MGTEKAFQKQEGVFLASKKVMAKKSVSGVRFYKKIGLGFKTPQTAIEGSYVDKKCPFTSNVAIRGRIFKGVVIRRDYLHYIKKYRRFEKRHKTVSAHCSPAFRIKPGDVVTVGQCRPLSKTVRFNVVRKEVQHVEGNVKKVFVLF